MLFKRIIEINGKAFKESRGPCIYAWIRNNKCLYVGFSASGIARVYQGNHHAIKSKIVLDTDSIKVWYTESEDIAFTLESYLIKKYRPLYNIQGNPRYDILTTKQLTKELTKDLGKLLNIK